MQTTLIDAIGTCHTPVVKNELCKIVSLVPSLTELICHLGLQSLLVGRTGFCIHPKELKSVPKIGGTKDVNIEKIRQLAPTHLLVNIDENEKETVELLSQFIPHIIVTHPIHPVDNISLYQLIGGIFNANHKAKELCDEFSFAFKKLEEIPIKKNIIYCIWKNPWMTVSAETYIANMLALKGWNQIQISSEKRYPSFEWSDLNLQEVDAIFLSTEPFQFTQLHVEQLQSEIKKPVFLIDGEMLSWYGSRAVQGLHYLKQLPSL